MYTQMDLHIVVCVLGIPLIPEFDEGESCFRERRRNREHSLLGISCRSKRGGDESEGSASSPPGGGYEGQEFNIPTVRTMGTLLGPRSSSSYDSVKS
jgi:hypothetical protein